MDIIVLQDAELITLGAKINGGSFGKDPCRLNKLAKVAYIRELSREKYGDKANLFVDGFAKAIINARQSGGSEGFSSHGTTRHGIETEVQGDGQEDGETEGSEEQESWESEHEKTREDFEDPADYNEDGTCKECGMHPRDTSKNHGHIGHDQVCKTEAREDQEFEEYQDGQEYGGGSGGQGGSQGSSQGSGKSQDGDEGEDGSEGSEEVEDEGSEDQGSGDSEETEDEGFDGQSEDQDEDESDSDEDEFQDQNEDEGTPKEEKPKNRQQKRNEERKEQKQQEKRDALEDRVREIVASMFEEELFPKLDEGLKEGFGELARSIATSVTQKIEELKDIVENRKPELDEERVKEVIEEALASRKSQARDITITFPNIPKVSLEGKHPIFPKLLALMSLQSHLRVPIMLVGPAGSGKSHVCKQVAEALGIPFGALSLSADMTRGAIEGRVMPLGEGKYVASEFVRIYENGGLYLFDEIDAGAAEVIVTVNGALANGGMHVEARAISGLSTYVPKHMSTRVMAAANTFGLGPTAQYVGRSQMDAATLDRWAILYMDYSKELLAATLGAECEPSETWVPMQRTEDELRSAMREVHAWIEGVYHRMSEGMLKRIFYQRAGERARALLTAGFTTEETHEVLLAGWKDDERMQVLN